MGKLTVVLLLITADNLSWSFECNVQDHRTTWQDFLMEMLCQRSTAGEQLTELGPALITGLPCSRPDPQSRLALQSRSGDSETLIGPRISHVRKLSQKVSACQQPSLTYRVVTQWQLLRYGPKDCVVVVQGFRLIRTVGGCGLNRIVDGLVSAKIFINHSLCAYRQCMCAMLAHQQRPKACRR